MRPLCIPEPDAFRSPQIRFLVAEYDGDVLHDAVMLSNNAPRPSKVDVGRVDARRTKQQKRHGTFRLY
jgi:hypothetical protein